MAVMTTTQTTTAPPEPALLPGQEFGIEPNPAEFPWRLLEGLDHVGTGRLRVILWRLLNAADASSREWRRIACNECAAVVWDELRRRGCKGVDGSKGGSDYGAVADVW